VIYGEATCAHDVSEIYFKSQVWVVGPFGF
jgi:hypothetical protein